MTRHSLGNQDASGRETSGTLCRMTAAGARPDPGFVGRADEVARLTEAVRSAQAGSSPLCLVVGEAGIGKSRLAARVAAEARGLGFDVVWTEAEEGAGPFSALAGLRAGSGAVPGGDDARWEQLEAVAAAIAARAPVLVIVEDLHWADTRRRGSWSDSAASCRAWPHRCW